MNYKDGFMFFEGEAYYPKRGFDNYVKSYRDLAEAIDANPPGTGKWQIIARRNQNMLHRDDDGVWRDAQSFLPVDVEKVVEMYK